MAFASTRTGPAPALLPPVLATVQQRALLTRRKSLGKELVGKGDEDRQRLRG